MHPPPVFRFAPSPNGELHLGHALSALLGFERARALGGRFLLRIEDIDAGRTQAKFIAAILADLRWLGLSWAEPVGTGYSVMTPESVMRATLFAVNAASVNQR